MQATAVTSVLVVKKQQERKATKIDSRAGAMPSSGQPDELLYAEILDAILGQRLSPGTKLTEEHLGDIFGVSRAVVRRALLRLSHDKVVEMRPNRGAYVTTLTTEQAREVLSARRLIETEIARIAADSISPEQIEKLRDVIEQEKDFFNCGNRASGIRLSGDFHLKLANFAGNATLASFINSLVPMTSLAIVCFEMPGPEVCSYDEHFQLLDVLVAGNSAKAADYMNEHLRQLELRLDLGDMESQNDLEAVFAHVTSRNNP